MRFLSKVLASALALSCGISSVLAHTATEWRDSRVVYQILVDRFSKSNGDTSYCGDLSNFCGGTFLGIEQRLDYIQGMGFNAIWISPVVQNSDKGYHGYWAKDWDTIAQEFGGADALQSLVNAAHDRGMWVMVGVVANHVGNVGIGGINQISPFNQSYHYHDCSGCPSDCNINVWDGSYVEEHCRLASLPDLDQDNSYVRSYLLNWVSNLVQTYGFDGIRVDTVPMVKRPFWVEFQQSAGVYAVGEVFTGDTKMVASYQSTGGLNALLSYPLYMTVISSFAGKQSMWNLHNVLSDYSTFPDRSVLGTFLDNHDNPRFLNHNSDHNLLKNALTFSLLAEGVPIMYYGTEQGYAGGNDPNDREPLWHSGYPTSSDLYQFVKKVVTFRVENNLGGTSMDEKWVMDWVYAYNRGGKALVVTTNSYDTHSWSLTNVGFADGTVLCNLFDPTDCLTVSGGAVYMTVANCQPKVYSQYVTKVM
eukprot:TRINITY_DN252_c0_g1_i1.p1 TRINITY_DN252_c0_g1~~TRINITY_DN252_c0_g1_i1.p1  ORF type:complete len:476 (+),score=111.34 TRINITY_DN252_c0_g1_i1:62-1489(+)